MIAYVDSRTPEQRAEDAAVDWTLTTTSTEPMQFVNSVADTGKTRFSSIHVPDKGSLSGKDDTPSLQRQKKVRPPIMG